MRSPWHLGYILAQRGQYHEAEQLLTEAFQIERNVFGENSDRLAMIKSHFSLLYERAATRLARSRAAQDAIAIETKVHGADHFMTATIRYARRPLFEDRRPRARGGHRKAGADDFLEVAAGPASLCRSARQTLGEVLLARGALGVAETELRTAVDINTSLVGADHWRTARSAASLGWALIKNDKADQGELMLVAARTQLLSTVGLRIRRRSSPAPAWPNTTVPGIAMPMQPRFSRPDKR